LNQAKLENLVKVEIQKNEKDLIEYKKGDYIVGDIFGNGETRNYKWKEYEEQKYLQNPFANGNVDLILTGSFINSFFLLYKNNGKYLFDAKNKIRKKELTTRYGNDIMGLNKDKFGRFLISYILDDFRKVLKKQLGQ
jgi:hypothetical protein